MWLLARILPFLVGDLIPRDYPQWECFLKLLQICDICTAPSVLPDTAMYLELLIEEHHTQFSVLYGKNLIIPKMHFMVHYPGQIFRFGPLIQAWTMRHEAKLRIIKRAARASNYKNVPDSSKTAPALAMLLPSYKQTSSTKCRDRSMQITQLYC